MEKNLLQIGDPLKYLEKDGTTSLAIISEIDTNTAKAEFSDKGVIWVGRDIANLGKRWTFSRELNVPLTALEFLETVQACDEVLTLKIYIHKDTPNEYAVLVTLVSHGRDGSLFDKDMTFKFGLMAWIRNEIANDRFNGLVAYDNFNRSIEFKTFRLDGTPLK